MERPPDNLRTIQHEISPQPIRPGPTPTNDQSPHIRILEALTLNVPRLREPNYPQWKLALGDAIKTAGLWGYIDGSIARPSLDDIGAYEKYAREAGAVRKVIFSTLESGVYRHLDGTLTPREAWLALERHYLPNTEDFTSWGVPSDIRAFGLTGGRNPLLTDRAAVTCRDCLLKDHKAGIPECPQYAWRMELWGLVPQYPSIGAGLGGDQNADACVDTTDLAPAVELSNESETTVTKCGDKRVTFEFSEPFATKIVLSFDKLGLKEGLLRGINVYDFKQLSEIQRHVIPMVMEGRSVIAQAHPKAGKTTCLAISILQSINTNSNDTQALALCPTDWSATNIQSTIHALGGNIGVRCFAYTSNASIGKTLLRLATDRSPHVVIGAPDGVLNLIRKGILRTDNVKMLVLEDMDQLINMGFKDQILDIHRLLPSRIQSIAMSTTLPQSFLETSTKVAVNPIRVTVERDVYMPIPEGIKQFHIDVHRDDRSKFKLIYHLFSILNVWPAVVFCNHTPQASKLKNQLVDGAYNERGLGQLFRNSDSDKQGNANDSRYTLVTTDDMGGAQGFDMQHISCIVNYELPNTREKYVRRISHFGGPGREVVVINFVGYSSHDGEFIREVEKFYGIQIVQHTQGVDTSGSRR